MSAVFNNILTICRSTLFFLFADSHGHLTVVGAVGLNVCALISSWMSVTFDNILAPDKGTLASFSRLATIRSQLRRSPRRSHSSGTTCIRRGIRFEYLCTIQFLDVGGIFAVCVCTPFYSLAFNGGHLAVVGAVGLNVRAMFDSWTSMAFSNILVPHNGYADLRSIRLCDTEGSASGKTTRLQRRSGLSPGCR